MVPIRDSSQRLLQLNPVTFNYKDEPDIVYESFIAHELAAYVPHAVIGLKDDVDEQGGVKPQMVDLTKIIPLLTSALQEALRRIDGLEHDIAAINDISRSP